MKTSFLPKLVNGQNGDPALYVDMLQEKRSLLFDCGALTSLSPSEIMRITDVFISHAHIDHFIGFDHLLRIHMGRGRRVRIFGPKGIIDRVAGKLSGYTWNLVHRQRLVFEVREWDGRKTRVCEFFCRQGFRRNSSKLLPASDHLWKDQLITVHSVILDHKIPSMAFSVRERDFYNVDPIQLESVGLRPGPWLNQLKQWVRQGKPPGEILMIEDQPHPPDVLADRLLIFKPGQKIAFVTDALGCEKNFQAIHLLANDSDLFFCEGAFLHEDLERAKETYHLTAHQAGIAAKTARVKRLVVFHFSPKYEGNFHLLEQEAEKAFKDL